MGQILLFALLSLVANADSTAEVAALVREAEEKAWRACCRCGLEGSFRDDKTPIGVLCDYHQAVRT